MKNLFFPFLLTSILIASCNESKIEMVEEDEKSRENVEVRVHTDSTNQLKKQSRSLKDGKIPMH